MNTDLEPPYQIKLFPKSGELNISQGVFRLVSYMFILQLVFLKERMRALDMKRQTERS